MSVERTPTWRWPLVLFRTATTLAAVLIAVQPVLAGGLLQGHYSMLAAHSAVASAVGAVLLVALVGGVLLWRPGGGPGRPAALCAVALLLCVAQIGLGYTRVLILHVPLGVIVVGLVIQIAVLSWQPPRRRDAVVAGGRPAEGVAGA